MNKLTKKPAPKRNFRILKDLSIKEKYEFIKLYYLEEVPVYELAIKYDVSLETANRLLLMMSRDIAIMNEIRMQKERRDILLYE